MATFHSPTGVRPGRVIGPDEKRTFNFEMSDWAGAPGVAAALRRRQLTLPASNRPTATLHVPLIFTRD